MANGTNNTSTPGMLAAASTIENTQQQIAAQKQQVNSLLDSLSVSWTGQAAGVFRKSTDPWFQAVTTLLNSLGVMKEELDSNRQDITRTEDAASQTASSMAAQAALNM